ncbi:ERF family protein [Clostridium sp. HBUAS56017]|uniref:ERF family protein n=1 Tax=Clostridium sp. HBUAS56017 TaxID=2571128 RepID=UPI001177C82A|nr:ERF family protein [Clostridium sp. HBUAS56017]
MEENKKLNIYQKLQKVRKLVNEAELTKTGKNTFSKYTYFELSDFLPTVTKHCEEVGISPIMDIFIDDIATLKIFDNDDPKQCINFTMNVKVSALKGCNEMQNIGGAYSYAKRYLYMNAFEISENDTTEELGDEEKAREPISNVHVKVIEKLIKDTGTDEVSLLTWAKVKSIKEIENKDLPYIMNVLNKKAEEIEKKKQAKGVK